MLLQARLLSLTEVTHDVPANFLANDRVSHVELPDGCMRAGLGEHVENRKPDDDCQAHAYVHEGKQCSRQIQHPSRRVA
jgi:hypothetical protein